MACGGFAAEFYLLNNGLADLGPDEKKHINKIVFNNATSDCEAFLDASGSDGEFTEAETKEL